MNYLDKSKEELIQEIQVLQQEKNFLKTFYEDKDRQVDTQLKESEEKFKTIFDKSLSAMIIADDLGNYLAVNQAASQLFGYSMSEFVQMNVRDLITVSDPNASERYKEYIRKGEEIGEFDFVSKDGIPKIVQYQAIRLKPNFNLSIMMEITKLKQVEQELKINMKKLESLNNTKDKFFSIIAHDLRNPFAGIIGLSEVAVTKLREEKKEESELLKYMELICAAGKSGFDLLENLMKWVKSQTGEIDFNPENISMNYLISHAIAITEGNAYNKNITIQSQLSENDIVFADESLTNTILRNLLTNAIKFTHSNGKITISAKEKNDFFEISILDSGIGIDPANLQRIFILNSQSSKLGTNKEGGTGLGLILCKEFVEKQGGTIWVESELGKGSKFTFTLPKGKSNA